VQKGACPSQSIRVVLLVQRCAAGESKDRAHARLVVVEGALLDLVHLREFRDCWEPAGGLRLINFLARCKNSGDEKCSVAVTSRTFY
jgi:hypothetical protein